MAKYLRKTLNLPNGTRKDIYAKTPEELEEKVLEARLLLRAGIDISQNTTFGDFAQLWYTTYKKPNLRTASQYAYQNALNTHILPYLSNVPIRDVQPIHIHTVMNKLAGKSKSLGSIVLITLRQIFDAAEENNLIARSPVPKSMKPAGTPKHEKRALTAEEESKLLLMSEGTPIYLFIRVALDTGMRRGELCGLEWDCVDFKNRTISVRRNAVYTGWGPELNEYPKTESGRRTIPITDELVQLLRQERTSTNSIFVFHDKKGKMMNRNLLNTNWAGIENVLGFHITPHLLRHTFVTRCFNNGLDIKEIQRLVGHSSPEITLKLYTHYLEVERAEDTFRKVRDMRASV